MRAYFALALHIVTLVTTFGLRTAVQRRRYGDSGWRFQRSTGRAAVAQVLLVSGFVLLSAAVIAAASADAAHEPFGITALTRSGTVLGSAGAAAGTIVAVGGAAVILIAQCQMGASWRIGVDAGERTELVSDGLFRRVRNPIFTGMAAFVLGIALLVPNLLAVAAVVTGLAGLQTQVRWIEEPYLRRVHGPAYLAWAATAGRFLPGVGRL